MMNSVFKILNLVRYLPADSLNIVEFIKSEDIIDRKGPETNSES